MKKLIFLLMAATIFAAPLKDEKNFKPRTIKQGVKVEVVSYKERRNTSNVRYRIYNSSGGVIEKLNVEIIFIDSSGRRLASYTTEIVDDRKKLGRGRERYHPSKSRYETYGRIGTKEVDKIRLEIKNLSILK